MPSDYADIFLISKEAVGFLALESDQSHCLDRFSFDDDMPFESTEGLMMMMSHNSIVHLCGGGTDVCYIMDLNEPGPATVNQNLKLLTPRSGAFAVETRNNEFWITGGVSGDGTGSPLSSTEIMRDGNMLPGPNLPVGLTDHCIARINHTHLLIHGGSLDGVQPTNRAFIFNIELEVTTEVRGSEESASNHICGMSIDEEEHRKIFIVGGRESKSHVEIYNVIEDTWETGSPLPGEAQGTKAIQLEDTFQVIDQTGKILEYDVGDKVWREWPKSVLVDNSNGGVLAIPAPTSLRTKCLEIPTRIA